MATLKTSTIGDLNLQEYTNRHNVEDFNTNTTYGYQFSTDKGVYIFVPDAVVTKGVVDKEKNKQHYSPTLLNREFLGSLYSTGAPVDLKDTKDFKDSGLFFNRLKEMGYGTSGVIMPWDTFLTSFVGQGDWKNYDLGSKTGSVSVGAIKGIGEKDGQLVYVPEASGARDATAYITGGPETQIKTDWITGGGGVLGGLVKEIAKIPFLPEIAGVVTGNPLVYAGLKGTQLGAQGVNPLEAGLMVGTTVAAPGIVKATLPAEIATIPGATQAVAGTATGLLSGQPIEQALQTGLATGAGSAIGGSVAGATGSQAAGQAAGSATAGLLAGGSPEAALIAGLASGAGTLAGEAVSGLTQPTQPPSTVPGTAGFADVSDQVYQGTGGTPVSSGIPVPSSNLVTSNIDNVSSVPTAPSTTATLPTTTPNTGSASMDDFWNELYAYDAEQLAKQGIPQSQISDILRYSGADTNIATDIAALASRGLNANDILTGLTTNYSYAPTGANLGADVGAAASNTLSNAVSSITRALVRNLLGGGAAGAGGAGGAGAGGAGDLLGGLLTGLVGRGIDAATANRIASDLQTTGETLAGAATAAGRAAEVPFTPYTVTTGLGTTTIGPEGATSTVSAPYENLRTAALERSLEAIGAINPAEASATLFGQLEGLQAPVRQREQEELLSRLGARGLLGLGRNVPTVEGITRGVNPYIESLLSSQATQQAKNALAATQFGTQEAMNLQTLSSNLQNQGMGIDAASRGMLGTAGTLAEAPRTLALTNAQRELEATLKGLGYRLPFETAAANVQAGQTGMIGQTTQDITAAIIKEIFG